MATGNQQKRVLLVMSSVDEMGLSGKQTGTWFTELAAPYYILTEAGHEVVGVHLALSASRETHRVGSRGCCTLEDARDARRIADVLGIPFYVWDLSEEFRREVVDDFIAEYQAGRTPNPCIRCNESIKFSAVLNKARGLGFDAVCTGHYARIENDQAG